MSAQNSGLVSITLLESSSWPGRSSWTLFEQAVLCCHGETRLEYGDSDLPVIFLCLGISAHVARPEPGNHLSAGCSQCRHLHQSNTNQYVVFPKIACWAVRGFADAELFVSILPDKFPFHTYTPNYGLWNGAIHPVPAQTSKLRHRHRLRTGSCLAAQCEG